MKFVDTELEVVDGSCCHILCLVWGSIALDQRGDESLWVKIAIHPYPSLDSVSGAVSHQGWTEFVEESFKSSKSSPPLVLRSTEGLQSILYQHIERLLIVVALDAVGDHLLIVCEVM